MNYIGAIKNKDYYTEGEIINSFSEINSDVWKGEIEFWETELEFTRTSYEVLTMFRDKVRYCISFFHNDPKIKVELKLLLFDKLPGLRKITYDT